MIYKRKTILSMLNQIGQKYSDKIVIFLPCLDLYNFNAKLNSLQELTQITDYKNQNNN